MLKEYSTARTGWFKSPARITKKNNGAEAAPMLLPD